MSLNTTSKHALNTCISENHNLFIPKTNLIHPAVGGNVPQLSHSVPNHLFKLTGMDASPTEQHANIKMLWLITHQFTNLFSSPVSFHDIDKVMGDIQYGHKTLPKKLIKNLLFRQITPAYGLRLHTDIHYCQHYHPILFYLLFPFSMSLSQAVKQI